MCSQTLTLTLLADDIFLLMAISLFIPQYLGLCSLIGAIKAVCRQSFSTGSDKHDSSGLNRTEAGFVPKHVKYSCGKEQIDNLQIEVSILAERMRPVT